MSSISNASDASVPTQRYHDLDAFRAWAVLLGLVLHVAWLMMPYTLNTPIVDVDGGPAGSWAFVFIHLFRMQAFFLVAGFFGNLVYQRRGLWGFTKHRLLRIGVPLVLGWLILIPWIELYYPWGNIVANSSSDASSLWVLFTQRLYTTYTTGIETGHLWFLWDLLLLYVATLATKLALDHGLDRTGRFRAWCAEQFRRRIQRPSCIFWLSIPIALLLLPMKYWIGIEGYPLWLIPDWYGFLSYWLIFVLGWMLYDQVDLLPVFRSTWKVNLLVGFMLSFPVWGLYEYQVRPMVSPIYPMLEGTDILDYSMVRQTLLAAETKDTSDADTIWARLSPTWQSRIAASPQLDVNQLNDFAEELTVKALLAEPLGGADVENSDPALVVVSNRTRLTAAFPTGTFKGPLVYTPAVWAFKALYASCYALAMWYLVFGFMGFFQATFQHPSPAMRYLSDSSYWIYLLHLPIVFWLAMYLGPVEVGFIGKFVAYNVLAVMILLPSYHYLCRSTLVGRVLNGRSYPYRPFFQSELFLQRSAEEVVPNPTASVELKEA